MFGLFKRKEQDGGQPRNIEEEALRWLRNAYRNTDTDRKKYTRWNMVAAYAAGRRIGESVPNPARPTF